MHKFVFSTSAKSDVGRSPFHFGTLTLSLLCGSFLVYATTTTNSIEATTAVDGTVLFTLFPMQIKFLFFR